MTPARDEAVRRLAGEAWRTRCRIEREAAGRFARLADRLAAAGFPAALAALARRSSSDERRHAELCAAEAARRGTPAQDDPAEPAEIAPAGLGPREAALYEVVAACCVTETESMSVLTTLLGSDPDPPLRPVLRELARDEVRHARLGWACLAHASGRSEAAFLSPHVPTMLSGAAPPDLFDEVGGERDDPSLLRHGVLPHRLKREVFLETLTQVIAPGLASLGVDPAPARAWLAARAGGR